MERQYWIQPTFCLCFAFYGIKLHMKGLWIWKSVTKWWLTLPSHSLAIQVRIHVCGGTSASKTRLSAAARVAHLIEVWRSIVAVYTVMPVTSNGHFAPNEIALFGRYNSYCRLFI